MPVATKSTKGPTLRRRPLKQAAKPFHATLQTDTDAPPITDKAMTARIAASHAGQPPPRLIFKKELLERLGGISAVLLWKWMKRGEFPLPLEVGGRVAWLESTVNDWVSQRPVRSYKKNEV